MARLLPEPSTGLTEATSGVAQPHPKVPPVEGSVNAPEPYPLVPPQGFAKLGWLNTLNISARNCTVRRSLNFQFLETDKSTLRKPLSRNTLRPKFPKVPTAGGTRTEWP